MLNKYGSCNAILVLHRYCSSIYGGCLPVPRSDVPEMRRPSNPQESGQIKQFHALKSTKRCRVLTIFEPQIRKIADTN